MYANASLRTIELRKLSSRIPIYIFFFEICWSRCRYKCRRQRSLYSAIAGPSLTQDTSLLIITREGILQSNGGFVNCYSYIQKKSFATLWKSYRVYFFDFMWCYTSRNFFHFYALGSADSERRSRVNYYSNKSKIVDIS